jgi:hypothetical protein
MMFAFLAAAALQIPLPLPPPPRPTEAAMRGANEAWAGCLVAAALRDEPSDRLVDAAVDAARVACSEAEAAFWRSWEAHMQVAAVGAAERREMRAMMAAEVGPGLRTIILQNRPAHLLAQLQEQAQARQALQASLAGAPSGDASARHRALLAAVDALAGSCWNQVTAANARTQAATDAIVALARDRCAPFRAELREVFALGRAIDGRRPDPSGADLDAEQIEQLREERMRRGIANIRTERR